MSPIDFPMVVVMISNRKTQNVSPLINPLAPFSGEGGGEGFPDVLTQPLTLAALDLSPNGER